MDFLSAQNPFMSLARSGNHSLKHGLKSVLELKIPAWTMEPTSCSCNSVCVREVSVFIPDTNVSESLSLDTRVLI